MSDAKRIGELLPPFRKTVCECGAEVEYVALEVDGRAFVPKLCERCMLAALGEESARLKVLEAPSREQALRERHEARWARLCPPKYRTIDERGETKTELLPAKQLARVLAWHDNDRPRGLLLHGPTDTGKTRCLYRLLRRLFDEDGVIRIFDCMSFAHECARAFARQEDEDWLNGIRKAEFVVFDDLFKMPMTDRVDAELFGLVEWLSANCIPVFITTNATQEWVEQRAQDPASRMSGDRAAALLTRLKLDCVPIEFPNHEPKGNP